MNHVLFVGEALKHYEKWWMERNLRRIGQKFEDFVFAEFPTKELIEKFDIKVMIPLGDVKSKKDHAYYIDTVWGIPEIPTFHPGYILKGNQKLSGAWCFAVERALKLASGKEKLREYELLLDPPLDEARLYFECGGLETLVCDIETSDWGGDEDEAEAESKGNIVRISFSNRVDTGISFPWQHPFIALCKDILLKARQVVFWNAQFDLPRLQAEHCVLNGTVIDAMFAWHWLQSDLPKALAFVAPLFVLLKPWKHLNSAQPAYYSAMDSAVTMDCYLGIREQLEQDGRWTDFERQCVRMFPILTQMSKAGVKLDLAHQQQFKQRLELERDEKLAEIQQQVPLEVRPTKIYKRKPKDMTDVIEQESPIPGAPAYEAPDVRWARMLPFNPASPLQVKNLIKHLGLKVPTVRGEDKESTQSKFLKKLSKKNAIFKTILEYRERCKVIDAYMWEVGPDERVHCSFSFIPSTWRKSCRNPNVQTVPKRNDLAAEFRRMVVADAGNLLVECDSSAIEAVLVGYFGGSERYIRLAKSGVHKWLAGEYAGRPVSKSEPLYDQIKRVVHLCLTCEHEILTPSGWKYIGDYQGGPVAQWEQGEIRFVTPSAYINNPFNGEILKFTGQAFSLACTMNHGLPVSIDHTFKVKKVDAQEIGNNMSIPLTGNFNGHISPTKEQIQLLVATQADGSIVCQKIRVALKLKRKIDRLLAILKDLPHDVKIYKDITVIKFATSLLGPCVDMLNAKKEFTWEVINLTYKAREIFINELPLWDGSFTESFRHKRVQYNTKILKNAEIVQAVAHLTGKQGLLRSTKVAGKIYWLVSINRRQFAYTRPIQREAIPFTGRVYCLTIPSGYFMIRHRGRISVTGNSNYMGTPRRIHEEYPDVFGNIKEAAALQEFYFSTEPGRDVRAWQQATLQQAHKEHRLDTPFRQRHFFYDVFTYREGQAVMGDDAKRAVAFKPQASASAIQTEFVLAIADHHQWMLPHLRWLVHDSIIAEVPEGDAERFARELVEVMTMPFEQLQGLSIGCEVKLGPNLRDMREVKL